MKYLKTYEILKEEFHYEIGDYVELTYYLDGDNWKNSYAEITGRGREGHNKEYVYYEIELFLVDLTSEGQEKYFPQYFFIAEKVIKRKLLKEEVKELLLKKEAEKYNL
jgi:hypothetical protein